MLVYTSTCTGKRLNPNGQGCVTPETKALPYCNTSLPIEERITNLLSYFDVAGLVSLISPDTEEGGCKETLLRFFSHLLHLVA